MKPHIPLSIVAPLAMLVTSCVWMPPRVYREAVIMQEEQSTPGAMPPAIAPAPSTSDGAGPCVSAPPHSAPLWYGPEVTLALEEPTIRLQSGNTPVVVHLPLASLVAGHRWTVKMWGNDANDATFLPAVDPETGLMDGMNDIDGDSLLETVGGNPAIVIEAFGDTDGSDGPDAPGWMVISR